MSNYQVQQLLGGSVCMPDVEAAFTVQVGTTYKLKCHCQQYGRTNGICSHVLVVVEKGGYLLKFVENFGSKANDPNAIIQFNLPGRAGDKPKQKKPRRGHNNVRKEPIVTYVQKSIGKRLEDPELDIPKPQKFTEYFHNTETFQIYFLLDKKCERAKACFSCKIAFGRDNPVTPEGDIVIVHKEQYERPVKDDDGKFMRMTISNQLGRKYYCLRKGCILRRHPYFWKGMLTIDESTRAALSPLHIISLNMSSIHSCKIWTFI